MISCVWKQTSYLNESETSEANVCFFFHDPVSDTVWCELQYHLGWEHRKMPKRNKLVFAETVGGSSISSRTTPGQEVLTLSEVE